MFVLRPIVLPRSAPNPTRARPPPRRPTGGLSKLQVLSRSSLPPAFPWIVGGASPPIDCNPGCNPDARERPDEHGQVIPPDDSGRIWATAGAALGLLARGSSASALRRARCGLSYPFKRTIELAVN